MRASMRSYASAVGDELVSSTKSYENEEDSAGSLSCEIDPSLTDCSVAPSRLAACTRASAVTRSSLMCEMAASRAGPRTVFCGGEAGGIDLGGVYIQMLCFCWGGYKKTIKIFFHFFFKKEEFVQEIRFRLEIEQFIRGRELNYKCRSQYYLNQF
jgi:hypothetical protein